MESKKYKKKLYKVARKLRNKKMVKSKKNMSKIL